MSDEEPTTTVDEGAAEAPSVVQDAPGFDWGDLAEDDLVKRHGGDPIKMAQSYKAMTQEFHQRSWEERQQAEQAAATPDEPWEPLQDTPLPANVDKVYLGKVGAAFQLDPVGTLAKLVAGGDDYAQYAGLVYDALKESVGDFRAMAIYQQILQQQQSSEWQQQLQAQVDEQVTPLRNEATFGKVDAGMAMAKGVMGDEAWAKFEPYLRNVTDPAKGGGPMPAHVINDPALMRDTLLKLYKWQLFEEQAAIEAAATTPATPAVPARRGAQSALSGNTASRPEDETEAQRIKRSVRETKIRVTD